MVLTDEDFKRANVEATQTVDIVAFVDAEEVAPTYFETRPIIWLRTSVARKDTLFSGKP